jgi:hypothetical protein
MNGVKNRIFDLLLSFYRWNHRIFACINLKSLGNPAGHTLNPPGFWTAGWFRFGPPVAPSLEKGTSRNKVLVMIHYSTCEEIKACRAFALERNRQMFAEAQALSRSAFELLEDSEMDGELFDRYLDLRRKANLKFQEAIEHLRVLNADFPPVSPSTQNAQRLHREVESRV